jgi:mannitol-specific phosphotransferase system IIBC component
MRKVLGLFVDDGWLATATLGVIASTEAIRFLLPASPMLAGTILVLGCLGALVGSVLAGLQK